MMSDSDGYSPVHDSITPAMAARQVALFKSMFGPPYVLVSVARCQDIQPEIERHNRGEAVEGKSLLAHLKPAPPFLKLIMSMALSDVLANWRRVEPEGEWLLVISGRDIRDIAERAENPLGFIDTPVLEKAIKYHKAGGHRGVI